MAGERRPPEDFETLYALSRYQQHQAARVVATASVDAADCAQLLAVLGIDPTNLSTLDDNDR
jgi:hypothetical protein